jgi:hypothetical protein
VKGNRSGLVLGVRLQANAQSEVFAPNACVRIAPDETVTVILSKSETGSTDLTAAATIEAPFL